MGRQSLLLGTRAHPSQQCCGLLGCRCDSMGRLGMLGIQGIRIVTHELKKLTMQLIEQCQLHAGPTALVTTYPAQGTGQGSA